MHEFEDPQRDRLYLSLYFSCITTEGDLALDDHFDMYTWSSYNSWLANVDSG